MREKILRLNENGGKQFESSRFPFLEVVTNMEGFSLFGNCVGVTPTVYNHPFLQ